MNELCISLQNNYEVLMNLIEKNIPLIWDYETKSINETINMGYSLNNYKVLTEFSKLGKKSFAYIFEYILYQFHYI